MDPFVLAFRSYFAQTVLPDATDVPARQEYLNTFVDAYEGPALPRGLGQPFMLAFQLLRLMERAEPRMSRDVFLCYAPAGLDPVQLGQLYDQVVAAPRILPPTAKQSRRPTHHANTCTML
jgi:hypothetical protein